MMSLQPVFSQPMFSSATALGGKAPLADSRFSAGQSLSASVRPQPRFGVLSPEQTELKAMTRLSPSTHLQMIFDFFEQHPELATASDHNCTQCGQSLPGDMIPANTSLDEAATLTAKNNALAATREIAQFMVTMLEKKLSGLARNTTLGGLQEMGRVWVKLHKEKVQMDNPFLTPILMAAAELRAATINWQRSDLEDSQA